MLRLEKYLENWYEIHPYEADPFDFKERIVRDDVSGMSDEELVDLLDDCPL